MNELFEWDAYKSKTNFDKHGVTFEDAITIWGQETVEIEKTIRLDSGEKRRATFGKIKDKIYAVIWTERNEKIRIISARRARKKEEQDYTSHFQNRERDG